ncbi:MAG: S1 RNA-binding domain-containing protein [Nanoarchaeota archaeon]|nr:S1 RNA-binding domain-containing protein [Nanoarchaeota archaeon]
MLLKKTGFPEDDSLVQCTITNIQYHSVFAKIDIYDKTGLIHISEIAPGRIRNIRDYISEGKKVICKILKIDRERGHIDLSLRRVNDNQRKMKLNEIKMEQKAEKIVEQVAKHNKMEVEKLYDDIGKNIFKTYPDLSACFKQVVDSPGLLEKLGIEKKLADEIEVIVATRFKPEDVVIGGTLKLKSFEPDGVEVVKRALKDTLAVDPHVSLTYLGGGSYKLEVLAHAYKDAEKILENALAKTLGFTKEGKGQADFARKG